MGESVVCFSLYQFKSASMKSVPNAIVFRFFAFGRECSEFAAKSVLDEEGTWFIVAARATLVRGRTGAANGEAETTGDGVACCDGGANGLWETTGTGFVSGGCRSTAAGVGVDG